MVVELQPLAHHVSDAIGETFRVEALDLGQQDGEGVARRPRHPVGLPEIVPDGDADALEEAVAGAIAVRGVDLGEVVDVEQEDGKRMTESLRPLDFLFERGDEDRACMQRRQRIDRGRPARSRGRCIQ